MLSNIAENTSEDMAEEDLASLDFEAWEHKEGEWTPPTNEEWAKLANLHLITVRMAWHALFKSKPEMISMIEGMDGEGVFERYLSSIHDSVDFFEAIVSVLKTAEARTICAGYSIIDGK